MRRVGLFAVSLVAACDTTQTAATSEFFGPRIEPPRGLASIRPGMNVNEARRAVPALRDDPRALRSMLVLDSGVSDVKLEVHIEADTVASIIAIVSGGRTRDLLTRAWGMPAITRDSLDQPEVTWASESTGWKAKLDCVERNCTIEYAPFHPLTSDYFGPHVLPPGQLARLRLGMKVDEARKLAPGPVDVRAGVPTRIDGVREFVAIDEKLAVVRAIYVNLPKGAEQDIVDAWGQGLPAIEPVGKSVLVWPDPTTGWRAILRPALGSSQDLAFEHYLPASQLFGEQPDVLDGAPVLGMPLDQLKRNYEGQLSPSGRDFVLTLLPTEWERTATRIMLDMEGGRVNELSFSIPYKAHPEARDSLLELFTHKWGEPRAGEDNGKRILVFRDWQPRVEVREDLAHGAWKIEIR